MDPAPIFRERPTSPVVRDALWFGAPLAALAVLAAGLGAPWLAAACALLAAFVVLFFRNPERELPPGEERVVAPADGRVVEVGEVEEQGEKRLRIGIFLSIFDVHVNRMPVSGRVLSIERGGSRFLPAFDRRAERENVRLTLTLETASGLRVRVAQITGLVARRIVCHPRVGDWVERGARFGLIRFGSRTDVVLPVGSRACVEPGRRVRGGRDVVALLPGAAP